MEFFAAVNKAESKWNTKGRNTTFSISKEDKDAEYWPRLFKDKAKNSRISVDWSKWVDEDEADNAPEVGGDFDQSQMQGFGGGMPGMGGMGGMPGMGGMGGMDMASMMKGMGGMGGMGGMPGMGGMGGMGGMDMEALMKQMGGMGGMGGMGMDGGDSDEEEDEAEGDP